MFGIHLKKVNILYVLVFKQTISGIQTYLIFLNSTCVCTVDSIYETDSIWQVFQ